MERRSFVRGAGLAGVLLAGHWAARRASSNDRSAAAASAA